MKYINFLIIILFLSIIPQRIIKHALLFVHFSIGVGFYTFKIFSVEVLTTVIFSCFKLALIRSTYIQTLLIVKALDCTMPYWCILSIESLLY